MNIELMFGGEHNMSYLRSIKVKNGDHFTTCHYYTCDNCGKELFEADNDYSDGKGYDLCRECAFALGKFTEKQFLDSIGIGLDSFHAAIHEGKIIVWQGKPTPPFKRTDKQQRKTTQYVSWRNAVYERDNYTCQDCNVRGGVLNAHHLQGFKKHPKLRCKVENGITLCLKCHKKRHKRVVE
jgi:hypothetical protein